jgi:gliding motility-associated protein GldM
MISMMYIFLTAMLALNVSADILRGFTLVNQSLQKSLETSSKENENTFKEFTFLNYQNPKKVNDWFGRASVIRTEADSLVTIIEALKRQIVTEADGGSVQKFVNGVDPDSINNKDNLDVAAQIMIPNTPGAKKHGELLRARLDQFREDITFPDYTAEQKKSIERLFDTRKQGAQTWESQMFEMMPVAGAVTVLTQLQNSIRSTEGEALTYLMSKVDEKDFRVNSIEAFIIPEATYVMKGGQFKAKVVLAAIDTTQKPTVKIGNQVIPDGVVTRGASSVGTFPVTGNVELTPPGGGTPLLYPFKTEFTVGEPIATVSADLMNVFYAGFENPVSISAPGVPMSAISASMTNGTLTPKGGKWIAKPTKIGEMSVVSVTAKVNGRTISLGGTSFRVKPLPPPVAFIEYKDGAGITQRYKGGTRFKKSDLLSANGVRAALDDPDLDNIPFTVLSFEINFFDSMGNTVIERTDGNQFSDRQMTQMRGLSPGKQFYITKTQAKGPDGLTRTLPPIQVIVQ